MKCARAVLCSVNYNRKNSLKASIAEKDGTHIDRITLPVFFQLKIEEMAGNES